MKKNSHTKILITLLIGSSIFRFSATRCLHATPAQAPAHAPNGAMPNADAKASAGAQAGALKAKSGPGSPTRYQPGAISRRAEFFYDSIWGVDQLKVKSAESNEIIRFSYRVVDADKAKTLNDEKNTPSLIDPKAGVKLVVPSLEKVGKLRQVSKPQAGKMYWMAFSNKGRMVKPGDRVDIAIGNFHANGLVVE